MNDILWNNVCRRVHPWSTGSRVKVVASSEGGQLTYCAHRIPDPNFLYTEVDHSGITIITFPRFWLYPPFVLYTEVDNSGVTAITLPRLKHPIIAPLVGGATCVGKNITTARCSPVAPVGWPRAYHSDKTCYCRELQQFVGREVMCPCIGPML
jgi:hypothetical protein